jgi:anti-sigma regulatory factor (Ser/Thr protein kinase)
VEVRASPVVLLPYTPSSVPVARHRLRADLVSAGIFEPAVGDAALVVSELLSNAIRHAAPLPGSQVRVTWTLSDSTLCVAVSDAGTGPLPRPARPMLSAQGGRGLGIVESLSSRWGVRRDDGETTVWAVLAAPHANGAARQPAIAVGLQAAPEPEHSGADV